ncbi:MAG: ABC transporter permease [archaeon]|nr:ABC transporter permease [archaeon]
MPEDFTESLITHQPVNLTLKGNPSSQEYGVFMALFSGVLDGFSSQISGQTTKLIVFNNEPLNGTDSFNSFDYIVPGLIVFAVLMTVTTVSSNISKEVENGMLNRLKLSKMKSRDYVLTNLISWSLIGIIQVIILLIIAVLIGYHWKGGLISMIYAIILGIITTISSVALSMIIVSLSKSVEQATNLAPIIVVPLSFLAGSFSQ